MAIRRSRPHNIPCRRRGSNTLSRVYDLSCPGLVECTTLDGSLAPDQGSRVIDLTRFELHNGTVHIGCTSRFVTPASAWSYAASFAVTETLPPTALEVALSVQVRAGRVCIGLLEAEGKVFADEHVVGVAAEPQRIVLKAPRGSDVVALMLRSAESSEGGDAELLGPVEMRSDGADQGLLPHQRGFRAKSPLPDIARRLTGAGISGGRITILDVGANRGDRTAEFLEAFPAARVYAVEPHPDTARHLAARFRADPRVRVLSCALGSETATARLACYDNNAANALSPISDEGAYFLDGKVVSLGCIEVPVMPLDDVCAREGIVKIDLLKLDAQGHELAILKGADASLSAGCVGAILTEVMFVQVYERQASFFEMSAFLSARGFKVFDFYDFVYDSAGQLKWGDALFLPSDRTAS